jgi:4-amino-4-deoxy-L-arabinose transferase-like glycosyltransferase
MALFELDEHPMLLFTSAVFLTLYVAVGIAALRGHPPRSLKVSAGVTIALALLFLPSTALALPAALLLVLLMWLATLRKPVATRAG